MAYIVDPTDPTRPTLTDPADQGQEELRALKGYLQGLLPLSLGGMNFFRRNFIINGDPIFDQRNEGTSISLTLGSTPSEVYVADKWVACRATGVTATGQKVANSMGGPSAAQINLVTTVGAAPIAADYATLETGVEGFDAAALLWGTANAKPISISFTVKSPVTGNHAIAIRNKSTLIGGVTRTYIATINIPVANTTQRCTINNIPGDTAGAWATDNSMGLCLSFDQGSGSNFETAAGVWTAGDFTCTAGYAKVQSIAGTFSLADVQLEQAAAASQFEWLPYALKYELVARYYEKTFAIGVKPASNSTTSNMLSFFAPSAAGTWRTCWNFKVRKRGNVNVTFYGPASGTAEYWDFTVGAGAGGAVSLLLAGSDRIGITGPPAAGAAIGDYFGIHGTASIDFYG